MSARGWTGRDEAPKPGAKGEPRPSKYRAQRVTHGGIKYDSKAEMRRHHQLLLLEHAGEISKLQHQVRFELVPSVRFLDARKAKPAMVYVADFVYADKHGAQVIEDVKGVRTKEFVIKRHLMLALRGLHIHIVKAR